MSVLATEPQLTVVPAEPQQWTPARDMPTIYRDLTEGLRVMRARRGDVDVFWKYHDGDHDQVWYSESLRKAFGAGGMNDLQDNYCALAVNAPLSRLAIEGWQSRRPAETPPNAEPGAPVVDRMPGEPPPEPPADPMVLAAATQWDDNDMELEQDDATRAAFVAGLSFVFVWPRTGPDGQQTTNDDGLPAFDVITKDARNVHVARGHKMRSRLWAVQVWLTHDRWRASLYYSDQDGLPAEVVRLQTPPARNLSKQFPQTPGRFKLDEDDPGGPMPEVFAGKCPMVPFQIDRRGRSWLRDAVPVQDKINKLAANKMVAAEFLAFPQRYILTDQDIPDGALRYSPAKVLQLDPGGAIEESTGEQRGRTQVGEFSTADLAVYDKAKSAEVDTLFTIKLLPRHLRVNPGTSPSGDAVKADEGPFVQFVQDCQRMLGASWTDVQQLMGNDVVPVWSDAEVANAEAEARELALLTGAGVPLGSALRRVGWADEDIREAVRTEGELRLAKAAEARAAAERGALMFDQGRPADDQQED